jgi:hypothetical protein
MLLFQLVLCYLWFVSQVTRVSGVHVHHDVKNQSCSICEIDDSDGHEINCISSGFQQTFALMPKNPSNASLWHVLCDDDVQFQDNHPSVRFRRGREGIITVEATSNECIDQVVYISAVAVDINFFFDGGDSEDLPSPEEQLEMLHQRAVK